MLLLDTNVISELVRPTPSHAVIAYIQNLSPETLFTSAICEAEIRYGLARMPQGQRREDLTARMNELFEIGFTDQVLRFDSACALAYGEIRQAREAAGKPIAVEDAMIAATARAYGVRALVTRNTRDFVECGVTLIDPWEARSE